MPTEQVVVGYETGDGTERTVTVAVDRTERDPDGTFRGYADGTEVAEVPGATFAVAAEQYGGGV